MGRLFPPFVQGPGALGLLLVRLVVGAAFVLHGKPKVFSEQGLTGWMGPDAPVPGLLQAAAALSEYGGGFALMLGLLTPVASLLLAGTMSVAVLMVHVGHGHPFVAAVPGGPSYELGLVYLTVCILLLLIGPGSVSADAFLWQRAPVADKLP